MDASPSPQGTQPPAYPRLPDTPPLKHANGSAHEQDGSLPALQLCDIVMKGGITSGIVYPPAVSRLVAGNYQFQNIGGTSVGAMAAAGIAAAEFNRRCNGGSRAGFDYLQKDIQQWLGEDRNLLGLFQPDPSTRPLFEILLALMSAPKPQAGGEEKEPIVSGEGAGPLKLVPATAGGGVSTRSGDPTGRVGGTAIGSDPTGSVGSAAIEGDPTGSVGSTAIGGDPAGSVGSAAMAKTARMWQVLGKIGASWLVNYGPFSGSAVLGAVIGLVALELIPLALFALVDLVNHGAAMLLGWLFGVLYIVLGLVGLWLGWHLGNVLGAVFALPKNYYGICSGHDIQEQRKPNALANFLPWLGSTPPPLTDWFSGTLNRLAGKKFDDPPLTFGDLQEQGVQLKMISSNLSHNLPYILPEGLHNFIFNGSEMEKLFPLEIVEYMIEHQPTMEDPDPKKRPLIPADMLPDGYFYLPNEQDLPVVVAARMSLSYPMLLSAVPLYTISTEAYNWYKSRPQSQQMAKPGLQRNWFSDGGICSNFPMQFFDAWLPKWPTFGINLTDLSTQTSALQAEERINPAPVRGVLDEDKAAVFLPPIMGAQDPEWRDLDNSVLQFMRAIFGTAQNYRDTQQAGLPSYRERIVQIRLDHAEGGLNLAMPPEVIKRVGEKGARAGEVLCQQFDLERHTWVRFLVLMAQLERNVVAMKDVLRDLPFRQHMKDLRQSMEQQEQERAPVVIKEVEVSASGAEGEMRVVRPVVGKEGQVPADEAVPVAVAQEQGPEQVQSHRQTEEDLQQVVEWLKNYPYSAGKDEQWLRGALQRTDQLLAFIKDWDIEPRDEKQLPDFFHKGEPLPEPVLRVTPEM